MIFKLFDKLKPYGISIFIVLIVTPIFLETFGTKIFSETELQHESRSLYFLSNLLGQVAYPIFSSINNGYILLPCFEGMANSQEIFKKCAKLPNSTGVATLCLLLACVVSLLGGIIIYFTNTGLLLSRIPKNIIDTMMIATGVLSFAAGSAGIFIDLTHKVYSVILLLVSFALTAAAIFILKRTGNPKYLIIYLVSIIAICNLLKLAFNSDQLFEYKIFLFKDASPLSIRSVFDLIHGISFNYWGVMENGIEILNLGLYPLISMSTSLPYYLQCAGLKGDFNKELLALGLTNGFCSLGLFPSSFNCTGSLLFSLCGANNRFHSIVSGLSLISLLFIYQHVAPLIPSFAISILSQFIGASLLLGFVDQIRSSTWSDRIVLLMTISAYVLLKANAIFILIFGVVFNYLIAFLFSKKSSHIVIQKVNNKFIFVVEGSLDFRNIHEISEIVTFDCPDVVFDLTECAFVDYSANLELFSTLKRIKQAGITVQLIGRPSNLSNRVLNQI